MSSETDENAANTNSPPLSKTNGRYKGHGKEVIAFKYTDFSSIPKWLSDRDGWYPTHDGIINISILPENTTTLGRLGMRVSNENESAVVLYAPSVNLPVEAGDWVILKTDGSLDACKNDQFLTNYELVELKPEPCLVIAKYAPRRSEVNAFRYVGGRSVPNWLLQRGDWHWVDGENFCIHDEEGHRTINKGDWVISEHGGFGALKGFSHKEFVGLYEFIKLELTCKAPKIFEHVIRDNPEKRDELLSKTYLFTKRGSTDA